jgi:hypothetical protein
LKFHFTQNVCTKQLFAKKKKQKIHDRANQLLLKRQKSFADKEEEKTPEMNFPRPAQCRQQKKTRWRKKKYGKANWFMPHGRKFSGFRFPFAFLLQFFG